MKVFSSLLAGATAVTFASSAVALDKVQVFILMGQSNMLGEGKIAGNTNGTLEFAVHTEHKYQYLWDQQSNAWATSDNVFYNFIMGSGNASFERSQLLHNEFLTVTGKTIGPELGIGWKLADYTKEPVMMLKACIGNRALGWDLLPPGSKEWDYVDPKNASNIYTYAGYHDSPNRWPKGSVPKPVGWMAGEQYDGDTNRSQIILDNIAKYYPGATDYDIAGFLWWQGDRDSRDMALAGRYEKNLVQLVTELRTQFKAPNAKFVTASLGQTVMGSTDGGGLILDAMLDVANATLYPQYKGNVAAVYTHPLSMGSSSGAHYGGNAETYMNIGEAMGEAMVTLLKGDSKK